MPTAPWRDQRASGTSRARLSVPSPSTCSSATTAKIGQPRAQRSRTRCRRSRIAPPPTPSGPQAHARPRTGDPFIASGQFAWLFGSVKRREVRSGGIRWDQVASHLRSSGHDSGHESTSIQHRGAPCAVDAACVAVVAARCRARGGLDYEPRLIAIGRATLLVVLEPFARAAGDAIGTGPLVFERLVQDRPNAG